MKIPRAIHSLSEAFLLTSFQFLRLMRHIYICKDDSTTNAHCQNPLTVDQIAQYDFIGRAPHIVYDIYPTHLVFGLEVLI